LGGEGHTLAAVELMAKVGVNLFDVAHALARGLADLLFPNDIAAAHDHTNLLYRHTTLLRGFSNKEFAVNDGDASRSLANRDSAAPAARKPRSI
jgi:hypothetical protein